MSREDRNGNDRHIDEMTGKIPDGVREKIEDLLNAQTTMNRQRILDLVLTVERHRALLWNLPYSDEHEANIATMSFTDQQIARAAGMSGFVVHVLDDLMRGCEKVKELMEFRAPWDEKLSALLDAMSDEGEGK